MRGRRGAATARLRLRVGALVLCCLTGLGLAASPALAAGSRFSFGPARGPVGTELTVRGVVAPQDRAGLVQGPRLFLERRVGGGVLSLVVGPSAWHLDTAGRLRAVFVVPGRGRYLYDTPDAAVHATVPGRWTVSFPCHACPIGTFVVTAGGLPVTGFPTSAAAAAGLLLLVTGWGLARGRRT